MARGGRTGKRQTRDQRAPKCIPEMRSCTNSVEFGRRYLEGKFVLLFV